MHLSVKQLLDEALSPSIVDAAAILNQRSPSSTLDSNSALV